MGWKGGPDDWYNGQGANWADIVNDYLGADALQGDSGTLDALSEADGNTIYCPSWKSWTTASTGNAANHRRPYAFSWYAAGGGDWGAAGGHSGFTYNNLTGANTPDGFAVGTGSPSNLDLYVLGAKLDSFSSATDTFLLNEAEATTHWAMVKWNRLAGFSDSSTSISLASHIGIDPTNYPAWSSDGGTYAFRHAGGSANFLHMDGHADAKLPKTSVATDPNSQSPDDIDAFWRWAPKQYQ